MFNLWYCGGLAGSSKLCWKGPLWITQSKISAQTRVNQNRQLRATSSSVLNASRDRHLTTYLGSLFQCLTFKTKQPPKTPNNSQPLKLFPVCVQISVSTSLHPQNNIRMFNISEILIQDISWLLRDSIWNGISGFNQDHIRFNEKAAMLIPSFSQFKQKLSYFYAEMQFFGLSGEG